MDLVTAQHPKWRIHQDHETKGTSESLTSEGWHQQVKFRGWIDASTPERVGLEIEKCCLTKKTAVSGIVVESKNNKKIENEKQSFKKKISKKHRDLKENEKY